MPTSTVLGVTSQIQPCKLCAQPVNTYEYPGHKPMCYFCFNSTHQSTAKKPGVTLHSPLVRHGHSTGTFTYPKFAGME